MKYLGLLSVTALCLAVPVYAKAIETPTPSSTPIEKIKAQRPDEPLMASHLNAKSIRNLAHYSSLTYASGHSFYDTKVELIDSEGRTINRRSQYDPKKQYQFNSASSTQMTDTSIWFFSPTGESVETPDYNSCVFERPCKLTQNVVDYAYLASSGHNRRYWLASGVYDLPHVTQRKGGLSPQLITLHDGDMMIGRTNDFRYVPYEAERPLVKGTFAWMDYSGHYGSFGSVQNIRMATNGSNAAEFNEVIAETNLYSTGSLYLSNSDLYNHYTGKKKTYFNNVMTNSLELDDSVLTAIGERAVNIFAKDSSYINIFTSTLKAEGASALNLYGKNVDRTTMQYSILSSKGLTAGGIFLFGLTGGYQGIDIYDTKISINTTELYKEEITMAITLNHSTAQLYLSNSTIDVTANSSVHALYLYGKGEITLAGTTINAHSNYQNAYAVTPFGEVNVRFEKAPSTISVFAPETASILYGTDGTIEDHSEPASECHVNHIPLSCV